VGTKNTAKRPATHNADLHSHLSSARFLTLDRQFLSLDLEFSAVAPRGRRYHPSECEFNRASA
jgi:hypothetical protein